MNIASQGFKFVVTLLCSTLVVHAGLSETNKLAAVDEICDIISNKLGKITKEHLRDAFSQEVAKGFENEVPTTHGADRRNACIVQPKFDNEVAEGVLIVYLTQTTLQLTTDTTRAKVSENMDFITKQVFYPYDITGLAFGFYDASKSNKKEVTNEEISRLFFVCTYAMQPDKADRIRRNKLKDSIFEKLNLPAELTDRINNKTDALALRCAMRLANNRELGLKYTLPEETKLLKNFMVAGKDIDKTFENLPDTFSTVNGTSLPGPISISVAYFWERRFDKVNKKGKLHIAVVASYRITAMNEKDTRKILNQLSALNPNLGVPSVLAKEMAEFRALDLTAVHIPNIFSENVAGASTFIFPVVETALDIEIDINADLLHSFDERVKHCGSKAQIVGCGVAKIEFSHVMKKKCWRLVVVVIFKTMLFETVYVPDLGNSNAEAMVLVSQWRINSNAQKAFAESKRNDISNSNDQGAENLLPLVGKKPVAVAKGISGETYYIVCNAGTPYADFPAL